MNSADKQAVLHCLKAMIDEEVCEECPLYGTTGTDHCEEDCVRLAINVLSSSENPKVGHWEWNQYDANPKIGNFHCSLCHSIGRSYFDYCPYCGAKMSEIPTGGEDLTETWNGYHGQVTAPNGTFERIFNDADNDNDI